MSFTTGNFILTAFNPARALSGIPDPYIENDLLERI